MVLAAGGGVGREGLDGGVLVFGGRLAAGGGIGAGMVKLTLALTDGREASATRRW
jgi:hypothetical protein